ncbi:MAG: hypothetical protein JSS02_23245 [Planctomycetes bacterium]|nr:hypothetical protein [Planctomycetota bacterium]
MTMTEACVYSLARSLVVGLVAWPLCRVQTNWLRSLSDRRRAWAWWLVFLPFLCPELWTGYAWSGFAARLTGMGLWPSAAGTGTRQPLAILGRDALVDEVLLDLLLLFRAIPVGTLALYFAPPPRVSRAAWYCWQQATSPTARIMHTPVRTAGDQAGPAELSPRDTSTREQTGNPRYNRWRASLQFWLERQGARWPAWALMTLVTFQEFELASLLGRPAWTVWLFDAQVGGLALTESLRKTLLPVLCQATVLLPLMIWAFRQRASATTNACEPAPRHWYTSLVSWLAIGLGLLFLIGLPALHVGRDTWNGLWRVVQSPSQFRTLLSEIGAGLVYSLTAAGLTTFAVAILWRRAQSTRWGTISLCLCSGPGLIGPLVTGLALIRLLQEPGLRLIYKTPVSLLLGLVLWLLPRGFLLRALLQNSTPTQGSHLARLLSVAPAPRVRGAAGELLWKLRWRREFWGVVVLAYWAFFDLTTASLLAPVTIVSAPVMLYNQMHFGKNATLSALVLLTVLIPLGIFAVAGWSRRFLSVWLWR